VDQEDRRWG